MARLYRRGEEAPPWAEGISWAQWERWLWEMPRERIEDRIARRDYEKKREVEAEKALRKTTLPRNRR